MVKSDVGSVFKRMQMLPSCGQTWQDKNSFLVTSVITHMHDHTNDAYFLLFYNRLGKTIKKHFTDYTGFGYYWLDSYIQQQIGFALSLT